MTPEELSSFRERGYHVERRLFDDREIEILRQEADRLLTRTDVISPLNSRCEWKERHDTGENVLFRIDPYFDISPLFAEYSKHPRLQELLRDIYGEPGHVCHNQFIYKPPGTDGHKLHQDYVAWPIFPKSFHTVAIALDAHDAETGCIRVHPGDHKRGLQTPADGSFYFLDPASFDEGRLVDLKLSPGDAAVFGCWLPHQSEPNRSSSRWRRTLFYCCNADSDGGDIRIPYYEYFANWQRENALQAGRPAPQFW